MEREALLKLYKEADCALNISGSHDLNEELVSIRHLIYVESDPGVEQIKIDKGERDRISPGSSTPFYVRREYWHTRFRSADTRLYVAANPPTRGD